MDEAWHDLLKFVGIEEDIAEPGKGSAPGSKVHVKVSTGGERRGNGSPTAAVRRSRRRELLTASNVVRRSAGGACGWGARLGWSLFARTQETKGGLSAASLGVDAAC
jgi:hypothetical protein